MSQDCHGDYQKTKAQFLALLKHWKCPYLSSFSTTFLWGTYAHKAIAQDKTGYVICQVHQQPLSTGNSAGGLHPRVGRAGGGVGVQKWEALRALLCGINLRASETSLELVDQLCLSINDFIWTFLTTTDYLWLQCNDSKAEWEEKWEEFLHLSPDLS